MENRNLEEFIKQLNQSIKFSERSRTDYYIRLEQSKKREEKIMLKDLIKLSSFKIICFTSLKEIIETLQRQSSSINTIQEVINRLLICFEREGK